MDELPVIESASVASPAPGSPRFDFEQQLQARRGVVDAFLARVRADIEADYRTHAGDYLEAAFDLKFNPRSEKLDERSRTAKLSPQRLRGAMVRWRNYLDATKASRDPVFAPWHAFAALPSGETEFAARAIELAPSMALPENAKTYHPLVAARFADHPPAGMSEVAAVYAELLAAAEARWQDRLKSDPRAQYLEDSAWESIRQVLYGPNGPTVVRTEDLSAASRLLNRKENDERRKLESAITELQVTHPGARRGRCRSATRPGRWTRISSFAVTPDDREVPSLASSSNYSPHPVRSGSPSPTAAAGSNSRARSSIPETRSRPACWSTASGPSTSAHRSSAHPAILACGASRRATPSSSTTSRAS